MVPSSASVSSVLCIFMCIIALKLPAARLQECIAAADGASPDASTSLTCSVVAARQLSAVAREAVFFILEANMKDLYVSLAVGPHLVEYHTDNPPQLPVMPTPVCALLPPKGCL